MAKVTLENLATMIQKEFSSQREYFDTEIGLVRSELKSEIGLVRSELKSEASSIRAEMHFRFDKLEGEIADIKKEIEKLKKRTIDDDDALNGTIIKLEKRLVLAEKEIGRLKAAKC